VTLITHNEKQLLEFITENIRIKNNSYFPKYGLEIKSTSLFKKLTLSSILNKFFQELSEDKRQLLVTGFIISYLFERGKKRINDILAELNLPESEAIKSVKFAKRYLILENEREAIKAYALELENIQFLQEKIKNITKQITSIHKNKRDQISLIKQEECDSVLELLKTTFFKEKCSYKKLNFEKGDSFTPDTIKFLFIEEKHILNAIVEYRLEPNVIEKFREIKNKANNEQTLIMSHVQNAIEGLELTMGELKKRVKNKECNLKLNYTVN
jgi:hypothetical protein